MFSRQMLLTHCGFRDCSVTKRNMEKVVYEERFFVCLMAYRHLMGNLMPTFNFFYEFEVIKMICNSVFAIEYMVDGTRILCIYMFVGT